MEELLTATEAARILGLSEARVRQLAAQGALSAHRCPHGRLFVRQEVEALARSRRRKEVAGDGR
jgi:excisionase family DNA binding protein